MAGSTVREFERLIQSIQFENHQHIRKIEAADAQITSLRNEIKEKQHESKLMQEQTQKMLKDICEIRQQIENIWGSCRSIAQAREHLNKYKTEKTTKYKCMLEKIDKEKVEQTNMLERCKRLRVDYEAKYQSMPAYLRLKEAQKVLEEKNKLIAAATKRQAKLGRQLSPQKDDIDFDDWMMFILKVAEYKGGLTIYEKETRQAYEKKKKLEDILDARNGISVVDEQSVHMTIDSDLDSTVDDDMEVVTTEGEEMDGEQQVERSDREQEEIQRMGELEEEQNKEDWEGEKKKELKEHKKKEEEQWRKGKQGNKRNGEQEEEQREDGEQTGKTCIAKEGTGSCYNTLPATTVPNSTSVQESPGFKTGATSVAEASRSHSSAGVGHVSSEDCHAEDGAAGSEATLPTGSGLPACRPPHHQRQPMHPSQPEWNGYQAVPSQAAREEPDPSEATDILELTDGTAHMKLHPSSGDPHVSPYPGIAAGNGPSKRLPSSNGGLRPPSHPRVGVAGGTVPLPEPVSRRASSSSSLLMPPPSGAFISHPLDGRRQNATSSSNSFGKEPFPGMPSTSQLCSAGAFGVSHNERGRIARPRQNHLHELYGFFSTTASAESAAETSKSAPTVIPGQQVPGSRVQDALGANSAYSAQEKSLEKSSKYDAALAGNDQGKGRFQKTPFSRTSAVNFGLDRPCSRKPSLTSYSSWDTEQDIASLKMNVLPVTASLSSVPKVLFERVLLQKPAETTAQFMDHAKERPLARKDRFPEKSAVPISTSMPISTSTISSTSVTSSTSMRRSRDKLTVTTASAGNAQEKPEVIGDPPVRRASTRLSVDIAPTSRSQDKHPLNHASVHSALPAVQEPAVTRAPGIIHQGEGQLAKPTESSTPSDEDQEMLRLERLTITTRPSVDASTRVDRAQTQPAEKFARSKWFPPDLAQMMDGTPREGSKSHGVVGVPPPVSATAAGSVRTTMPPVFSMAKTEKLQSVRSSKPLSPPAQAPQTSPPAASHTPFSLGAVCEESMITEEPSLTWPEKERLRIPHLSDSQYEIGHKQNGHTQDRRDLQSHDRLSNGSVDVSRWSAPHCKTLRPESAVEAQETSSASQSGDIQSQKSLGSGRSGEDVDDMIPCSPFDFEKFKETVSKMKAFSPVTPTFTNRPMFEASDTTTPEEYEDAMPGHNFISPFLDSFHQEKAAQAKNDQHLFAGQEDSPKEADSAAGSFFNFAPNGEEDRVKGYLSFVSAFDGDSGHTSDDTSSRSTEDSSFLFSLGAPSFSDAQPSKSFSFNFGSSPVASPN